MLKKGAMTMGRSGVELAAAPIRAMSKASGLVFDHWVVLCVVFAVLAMAFLIFNIVWETRETRRLEEMYQEALAAEAVGSDDTPQET